MNRNAHILSLMSIAFAAFGLSIGAEVRTTLIAAGLLAAAAAATVLFERRAASTPAAVAGAPIARSTVQTKRLLMLLMAVGIVVYGGGAGTFATFSAETTNTNSQVASGTLTMSDAVTSGQTCFSASSSSSAITADNVNDLPAQQTLNGQNTTTSLGACDQILSLANVAPGTFAGSSSVTISNTGSIDAQKLKMFAPYVNTAYAGASDIPPSTNLATAYPTGITVLPIEGPIKQNDTIELDYGGSSYTATAAADANPLTTSLKLTGTTPAGVTFKPGTRITDTSTDGLNLSLQQENTDCFDVRNSTAQSVGATAGTDLNFNKFGGEKDATTHWVTDPTLTYTGPLCANLGFWIQEQSVVGGNTYNYCWYGDGATGSTHVLTNGMCRAPISASFASTPPSLPTGASTLALTLSTGLRGNVAQNDGIKISETAKTSVTCTANADAYIGALSITVTNCSAASPTLGGAFTTAAVITDTTTITDLSTDTQTIANFDTKNGAGAQLELPTLVANGTLANSGATVASVELGKAGSAGSVGANNTGSAPASRKFYFGVYLQTNTSTAQNAFQGLKSTFGIGWHIDQF